MAQQNTGLGWSAEQNYLVQSAAAEVAEIPAHIGGSSFPGQPLPVATTRLDVITNGFLLYEKTGLDNLRHKYYVASNTAGAILVADMGSAPASSFVMYRCVTNINGARYYMADSADPDYFYEADLSTSVGSGFYSTPGNEATSGGGSDYALNPQLPAFPDINSFIAAIETAAPTPITKTNAGYCVACYAQWYTQNGTELHSPILISSDSEFTEMSGPSGYNLATFNKLLSGLRFYMSFWDIPAAETLESSAPTVDLRQNGNLTLEQVFMYIVSTSYAHVIIINSPDPYEQEGGDGEEDGGDGEETGDDDAGIEAGSDFPSAINTGFCRIFSPSESELRNLSNYLWSSNYDLAQVKKLFSNPMDSILGLSAVPIRLLGSSVSFSLGGVPITGMTLPLVTKQRYTYHMGSITIKERWGSYLDYDPYTKFSIFLPFIGMRELAADDIMGKTVSLVYDIDILTGMCVARLQAGTNCLYEWGGNCAIQLPVNSRNWDSVFSTAVSAVGGIVSAVTGGSAPLVAGSVASAALQTVSMKPRIDKSSTIGGAAGWLGQMTPYIIRTTPEAFIPTDQNKFIGYPAYINVALNSISGYNEVESIHLENVTATGTELEEIESILKGGVIF